MRPEAREKALQTIKTSDTCKIILISFKAGSTGLNLTCCSRVLLMDLWWNPQIEEQAFDRAHRLGQNRPVHIYKLSVKNSVEERLLTIQQKKRDLANSALTGEKYVKGKQKLSWQDLMYLFNAN
jgi:SNF2 family DNA or RNA helicase